MCGLGAAQGFPCLLGRYWGSQHLTFGRDPSWLWEALARSRLLLVLICGPPHPEGLVLTACLGSSGPPPRPGASPGNPAAGLRLALDCLHLRVGPPLACVGLCLFCVVFSFSLFHPLHPGPLVPRLSSLPDFVCSCET